VHGLPGSDVPPITDEGGFFGDVTPGDRRLSIEFPDDAPSAAADDPFFFADSRVHVNAFFEDRGDGVAEVHLPDGAIEGTLEFEALPPEAEEGRLAWIVSARPAGSGRGPRCFARAGSYQGRLFERRSTRYSFRIEALPAGRYGLHVFLGELFLFDVFSEELSHAYSSDVLELRGGETLHGVHLRVPATSGERVSGPVRLVRADGKSTAMNRVHLLFPAGARKYADSTGVVRFEDLAAGRAIGLVPPPYYGDEFAPTLFEWELGRGEPFEVVLDQGGKAIVNVQDANGRPVRTARVSVFHSSGIDLFELEYDVIGRSWEIYTDVDGILHVDDLAAGEYEVDAHWRNRRSARVPVSIRKGETTRVTLNLP
jgi:hypothetical protein